MILEHLSSAKCVPGVNIDALNPLVVRLMGADMSRNTVENVRAAGLVVDRVEDLDGAGIFKLIVARRGTDS